MNLAPYLAWLTLLVASSVFADTHSVAGSENNLQNGDKNIYQSNSNNKTIIINQVKPKQPVKHRSNLGIVTIKKPDGSVYVGQVLNGKKHGTGTLTDLCRAEYVGEWKNDMRNGRGYQTFCVDFKLNGNSYNGEWVNNYLDGYGVYTYSNGTTLEGIFNDGFPSGACKKFYIKGDIFEGECAGFDNLRGKVSLSDNRGTFWGCLKENNFKDGFKRYADNSVTRFYDGVETLLVNGEHYNTDPIIACKSWNSRF